VSRDFTGLTSRAFAKADPDLFATTAERERLEALLTALESRLRRAFQTFLDQATDEAVVAQVSERLERGDVDGALDLIQPYIDQLGITLPRMYDAAATAETAALVEQIKPLRPTIGISFDPGNPRAAALMRENQLKFVTAFTDAQRAATREALTTGLERGQGFIAPSRVFRDSIGLTANQTQQTESYRRALQSADRNALTRALRDRRFDPSVEAAIDGRRPLTPDKIDTMVGRYRERQLAYRAETIARTESRKVLSEAQVEAMTQTMAATGIQPEDVEKTWLCTLDGRERLTHHMLHGQTRPFAGVFNSVSGAVLRYPGDGAAPASEICNCRCGMTFRILAAGPTRLAA
jgi:hypothetical protein